MTENQLHEFIESSTGNESNITQITAIKDGKIAYEDCWRGYRPTDAASVNSVTKGVMALLTGIALDKGCIKGIDQKVMDFFPDYQVKRGEKTIYDVTIRHLLTMTAPYKYRSEPWTKVCTSQDWTLAVLDYLGGRKGITGEFKYATLGIQILAGILEKATGEKLIDFANRNLFVPLGIPEHVIHGDSSKEDQFDFFMNRNPRKNEWYSDPQDTVTAGWGLCLSARDMARLGEMVLNDGTYEGKRILSADYIRDMSSSHLKLTERFGNMNYGYLWYRPFDDRNVIAAIGDFGNIIYVNKDRNISVGITGTFKPRIFDRVEFIEKRILPLIDESSGEPAEREKHGSNWTAFRDPETDRYFAEIMYTSREGREQYDYEITREIYDQLGRFDDDVDNERLIREGKITYSFENTMYGTLGPERTVWDEEAIDAMQKVKKG